MAFFKRGRRFKRYGFRRSFGRFRTAFRSRYRNFRSKRRRTYGSRKKTNWIQWLIGLLILGGAGFFVWKKFIKKV